jgi:hypothetical protein
MMLFVSSFSTANARFTAPLTLSLYTSGYNAVSRATNTEQSSWLLFLKYLDDLGQDKSTEAELEDKKYTYILDAHGVNSRSM